MTTTVSRIPLPSPTQGPGNDAVDPVRPVSDAVGKDSPKWVGDAGEESHALVVHGPNERGAPPAGRASEADATYRALVERIPAITYTARCDTARTMYLSPQTEALLGFLPEELAGAAAWHHRVHPDDQARVAAAVRRADETGGPYAEEYRMLARDGRVVWVCDEAALVRDGDGRPLNWHGVVLDVTARKEAEAALGRERDLLHALMEHFPDPIFFKDAESRFVRINHAEARHIGCADPAEAVGKTDFDLFPEDIARGFFADEQRLMATDRPSLNHLEQHTDAEGNARWVLTTKVAIRDPDGHASGLVGICRDVTELTRAEAAVREAEERFRGAFEAAAIGMAIVAPDGRFLRVNRSLCDLVAYPEDELLATTFQAITHHDDLGTDLDHVRRLLAGEVRAYQMEKRYVRKDRTIVWIRLSTSLVRDELGAPVHFVSQIEDVTPRKVAEDALRENEERLRLALTAARMSGWSWDLLTDRLVVFGHAAELFDLADGETLASIGAFLARVHPDDRERMREVDQRAIVDGQEYETDYRVVQDDGSVRWVVERGRVVDGRDGATARTIGVLLDVTERKAAETARQVALAAWTRLFDALPDHICVLDPSGRILQANQQMRDRFEPVHGDLIGLDYRLCYCGTATPEVQPLLSLIHI